MFIVLTFCWLLALWLAFAGSVAGWELLIGSGAAALALVAHAVVRRQRLAPFAPRWRHVAVLPRLFWDVVEATAIVVSRPPAHWLSAEVPRPAIDAPARSAQEALMVAFTNVSPATIVVALDPAAEALCLHQMGPTSLAATPRRLGAR